MCVFCEPDKNLIARESAWCYLIANFFPLGNLISLLAIPKRHITSIADLTIEEMSDLMQLITTATKKIKEDINPEGINILINEGKIAGQTVSHLHVHIVAREENDGLENFKCNKERHRITEKQLSFVKKLF
jgi:diadenosine tetraphosphate (Ap4A) HIT family hydrolase